jgi:hypothetical protein
VSARPMKNSSVFCGAVTAILVCRAMISPVVSVRAPPAATDWPGMPGAFGGCGRGDDAADADQKNDAKSAQVAAATVLFL